jgi:hypothetical protein
MTLELKKIVPVELRSVGLSEKWLQDQIQLDPTILGLGDLEIIGKEHRQALGGRIDFLMYDNDTDLFYEIEIMLGTLDESHIVRTIEYWDVERQRRPASEHRAVIVAENITSRFFNVLRLLNRSVPMIAVQLGAFKLDDNSIVLHAVTVLNVVEEATEPYISVEAEQTDRIFWEKKRDHASLAVMDKIVSAMKASGIPGDISYKKNDIPLGSTGNNFCWFRPRKTAGYCRVAIKLNSDSRDATLATLQEKGIDASPQGTRIVAFSITTKQLDEHLGAIIEVLKQAEELSR